MLSIYTEYGKFQITQENFYRFKNKMKELKQATSVKGMITGRSMWIFISSDNMAAFIDCLPIFSISEIDS